MSSKIQEEKWLHATTVLIQCRNYNLLNHLILIFRFNNFIKPKIRGRGGGDYEAGGGAPPFLPHAPLLDLEVV